MIIRHAETSFRARHFSETLNLLNQFKKLAGITRLADLTHLDYTSLPVYTAIRPRAKSLTTSQGKGLTKEAAKCSALMESIEVYFAEEIIPQVTNKSELELTQSNNLFIPINQLANSVRFTNPSQPINWVYADLVFSGKTILVPFAEYSLNSYLPEVLIYSPDTTGLTGGNNYKEALLHGILEVIERQDAQQITEIAFVNSNLVENLSIRFDCFITYQENYYRVPSFEVLLKSKNPFENQILFKGSGSHLNKKIALNRALTEAIQSRVTTIAGSRDDLINTKYDSKASEFPVVMNKKNFDEVQDYSVGTIEDALSVLYEKIKENNQDILVYTYYDKEICIVKVKLISMDLISHV
ncbi:YcaO-like family protein [Legionella pneumophila]|nr:YcaO-like family protein [Legionella pneumophila]MDW8883574.1 YcaO-like family protein [Legionella pneumophila]MDW8905167.1 YcaO-like family protein [Legionella pneumophila]MDX1853803.1 YcaO-like family protein [Legionella pneumophila]